MTVKATTKSNPNGKKRVKTDRIDARSISRILAYKSYSQVHLPDEKNRSTERIYTSRDAKIREIAELEIHDFTRFATAAQFVSFLGLCSVEDSSGKTKIMLPLTKAGNRSVCRQGNKKNQD